MKRLAGFAVVATMLAFGVAGCSTTQPVAAPGYNSAFSTPEPPDALSSERSHAPSQSGHAQTASANGNSAPPAPGGGAPPPPIVPMLAPPPPLVTVPPPAAPPPPPPPLGLP